MENLSTEITDADMSLGLTKIVQKSFAEAITAVTEALKKEGFGIITQIDVTATMKEKLGVDCTPYIILGACNPPFAHQALSVDPEIGLLLPCNVLIYINPAGETVVSFFDPELITKIMSNDQIQSLAHEVKKKIQKVYEEV